jgi:hypothetical protein
VTLFATTERPSIAHIPAPPESDEARYEINIIALHQIERELADSWRMVHGHLEKHKDGRSGFLRGELFCRVNAMQHDPELQSLEKNLAEVSRRRTFLYQQHAEMKRATGRTR